MKVALFGGTFNPIHIGHLAVADSAVSQFGFDKVAFVPVNIPPHKALARGASNEDRLRMIELSIKGNEHFYIEQCELYRSGPSYTSDTVEYILKTYEKQIQGRLGYIIGEDWIKDFHTWNRPEVIAGNCDLIIAKRPCDKKGVSYEDELKGFGYPYTFLDKEPLAISSSYIRESIASHRSWQYLVTDEVRQYIKDRALYGYR